MERGAQALVKILLASMLLGAAVLAFHPEYRNTVASLWRGEPAASDVWGSNATYYPAVGLPVTEAR